MCMFISLSSKEKNGFPVIIVILMAVLKKHVHQKSQDFPKWKIKITKILIIFSILDIKSRTVPGSEGQGRDRLVNWELAEVQAHTAGLSLGHGVGEMSLSAPQHVAMDISGEKRHMWHIKSVNTNWVHFVFKWLISDYRPPSASQPRCTILIEDF